MQAGSSQQQVTLSHRKQWATYEDSFACHYWHLWGEVRDIAKNATVHSTAPPTKKEFSGSNVSKAQVENLI